MTTAFIARALNRILGGCNLLHRTAARNLPLGEWMHRAQTGLLICFELSWSDLWPEMKAVGEDIVA